MGFIRRQQNRERRVPPNSETTSKTVDVPPIDGVKADAGKVTVSSRTGYMN